MTWILYRIQNMASIVEMDSRAAAHRNTVHHIINFATDGALTLGDLRLSSMVPKALKTGGDTAPFLFGFAFAVWFCVRC